MECWVLAKWVSPVLTGVTGSLMEKETLGLALNTRDANASLRGPPSQRAVGDSFFRLGPLGMLSSLDRSVPTASLEVKAPTKAVRLGQCHTKAGGHFRHGSWCPAGAERLNRRDPDDTYGPLSCLSAKVYV